MDVAIYPTEVDLLRALIPLVPPAILQSVLDDIGLGSVPHHRLLEEALVSIVQAVPPLRRRLFGQVHLGIEQAAGLLHTTPSALKQLLKANTVPTPAPEPGAAPIPAAGSVAGPDVPPAAHEPRIGRPRGPRH